MIAKHIALLLCAGCLLSAQQPNRHVNGQRLQSTLDKLSEYGRNPEGGVTRLGYSNTDLAARAYVISLMKDAGLTVRIDAAGNIFGRREGTERLPVLLSGSHIDSVLHGGNFDGDVGALSAIEVMRALKEQGVQTRHPLEAVVWTNEEGNHFGIGTMGSEIAGGRLGKEILDRKDDQGLTVADWLRKYGQDPLRLEDARIPKGAVSDYVELHIEQGPNLEEQHVPIGVVQGIVGIRDWGCVTNGFANHAGTTPMDRRRNALAAASRDVLAVREVVLSIPGRQVGNVGVMKVEPGAPNVIPGRVEFTVELRDLDAAKIDAMWSGVQAKFHQIDLEEKVETQCKLLDSSLPAKTDPRIQTAIRQAAASLQLPTMDLPSGAGHDAQSLTDVAPIGMIFVPSRAGISHSPKEFTSPQDAANGAEVLYRTLLLLDAH